MIRAVLSADFHLCSDAGNQTSIIPAMKWQKEILDSLVSRVSEIKPDVFILLGDNTNSGRPADMKMLFRYLQSLKNEGIEIIMIPGNHDLEGCTEAEYEKLFFPLLKPEEKDPCSLSYAKTEGDVLFLAMDDHEGRRSPCGVLKPETVSWLERQLVKARRNNLRVIFLSHHSLIHESWHTRSEFYCLQPASVSALLHKYAVRLAFSGHTHDAAVLNEGMLYGISVPMPEDGTHRFGVLEITDRTADYSLPFIPFEEPLRSRIALADEKSMQSREEVFRRLVEKCPVPQAALDALIAFHKAYICATLHAQRNQIMAMPGFRPAMEVLDGSIWQRLITCLLDEKRLPQDSLHIDF